MSPSSWISLPPPALSLPSRLLQGPNLSSLIHTASYHWLSILHMAVYNENDLKEKKKTHEVKLWNLFNNFAIERAT